MTFFARPDEPLVRHLEDVATRARESLAGTKFLPSSEHLSELAWICGATHDFGKYTSYFQDKLPPKSRKPSPEEYGHHAFVSALLGAFVARARYPEDPEAPLLVYLAIHRHHGQLVTPTEVLPRKKHLSDAPIFDGVQPPSLGRGLRAVHAQLKDMRGLARKVILDEMASLGIVEAEDFLNLERWWEDLHQMRSVYNHLMRDVPDCSTEETLHTRRYWRLLLLFSALIDADKHVSAATGSLGGEVKRERKFIPARLVDEYVASLKIDHELHGTEAKLAEIRRAVYREGMEAITQRSLEELSPGVLSLTAPTGSGKTLTALGCALRLRERIYEEHGYLPRIVYALPFVNIIDQNSEVAERVLRQHPDYHEAPSSYLLKHHHLAPQAFRENEDATNDEALLLTESWESEIVVTTFVQLFESLVTNRNRRLKKLHNLAGAIVVLDEIQSIPYEQWGLVGHVLTTLTVHLGCTVLQMTATRPRILPEAREVLDHPERHFAGLSRTIIIPRPEIRTLDDLKTLVGKLAEPDTSLLVVLNTIGDAVSLYRKLREDSEFIPYREFGRVRRRSLDGASPRPLIHLSTNITPWQRAHRVRMLRRYMQFGGKPIVISTQVVEAGVDLDFDVVVRDQGPLDSIIQAAGRCNRVGAAGESRPVYVTYLERENGSTSASLVYGKILPQMSKEILASPIEESALYEELEKYFSLFLNRLNDYFSSEYIDAIKHLRFYERDDQRETVGKYRHIESQEQVSILVEINKEAKSAIERLEILYLNSGNRHDFREAYRKLGTFIITPSKNRASRNPPAEHPEIPEHLYIPLGDVVAETPSYYDIETGFKWEETMAIL